MPVPITAASVLLLSRRANLSWNRSISRRWLTASQKIVCLPSRGNARYKRSRAQQCSNTLGLSLATDNAGDHRTVPFECCREYRNPRDVESHVVFAGPASNENNASQVCLSISSTQGCTSSNHYSRAQLERQTSLDEEACRQPSKADQWNHRELKQSRLQHTGFNSRLNPSIPSRRVTHRFGRLHVEIHATSVSTVLMDLCDKRSMACRCFNSLMLWPLTSHLGLHIW